MTGVGVGIGIGQGLFKNPGDENFVLKVRSLSFD
jgi:hypothetical protein